MPYIEPSEREMLDRGEVHPNSVGQLNYMITSLVDDWLSIGVNYGRINEAIGVLECAKLELYRRIAAPYEDVKRAENGDVYTASSLTKVERLVAEVVGSAVPHHRVHAERPGNPATERAQALAHHERVAQYEPPDELREERDNPTEES